MLKKLVVASSFLYSFSAFCLTDINTELLAKQCSELSQTIEQLSVNQNSSCASIIKRSGQLVNEGGVFILKNNYLVARVDLLQSSILLRTAKQIKCRAATKISSAQESVGILLVQLRELE